MAREDFYRDLLRAWRDRYITPTVVTDDTHANVAVLSRVIKNADLWLTPKVIEEYRASDFADTDPTLVGNLERAVEDFRSVAAQVPNNRPASEEQLRAARDRFDRLALVARDIILRDWLPSIESAVKEAARWCRERNWPDRLYTKDATESLLGTYQVPQLLFQAEGVRIELSPVARFVPGALGLMELRLIPSYDAIKLTRGRDGWRIHLEGKDVHSVRVIPWDEPGFEQAVLWLKQQG